MAKKATTGKSKDGKNDREIASRKTCKRPQGKRRGAAKSVKAHASRCNQEVFRLVRQILVGQLGVKPKQVTLEASLTDDLGADSIDLVELVMLFVAEVFHDGLPDDEIQDLTTVGKIVDYLQSRLVSEA